MSFCTTGVACSFILYSCLVDLFSIIFFSSCFSLASIYLLLELISCSCYFICYILFCSLSLVSTDFCYCSLRLHLCFIVYHCSVFCSSILMMNNFCAFNLFIFCHYILQFLYIHCIISAIPDKYISVCVTIFYLMLL